jgi:hypothetical protein
MRRIEIADLGGMQTLARETLAAVRGGEKPRPGTLEDYEDRLRRYQACVDSVVRLGYDVRVARGACIGILYPDRRVSLGRRVLSVRGFR